MTAAPAATPAPADLISPPPASIDLHALHDRLGRLRGELLLLEAEVCDDLAALESGHRPGGRNLVHYLAMRRHDLRQVQGTLASLGLSSLGRCESNVLPNLDAVVHALECVRAAEQGRVAPGNRGGTSWHEEGRIALGANTVRLFGPRPDKRDVRIMVTMPADAADDYDSVRDMLAAGMDCVRINCAHDDERVWGAIIDHVERARAELGRECKVSMDLAGPNPRTGPVVGGPDAAYRVHRGERLLITRDTKPGAPPVRDPATGVITAPGTISCTLPAVLDDLKPGERVWVNEGKLGCVVRECRPEGVLVEVVRARDKGEKVRPEKGINFPDSSLRVAALTQKDVRDLAFIVRRADLVSYSFVRSPQDVRDLHTQLDRLGRGDMGVLLKIESRQAFAEVPAILLSAMRKPRVGVMIARGDMALESGFERLAELQEELLWICEAAHVPVVWATEVLTTLAKTGRPSRGEITDAAMAVRAECVMLNKGEYILDTIRMLDDILRRMAEHQQKKASLFRGLRVATHFVEAAHARHADGAS